MVRNEHGKWVEQDKASRPSSPVQPDDTLVLRYSQRKVRVLVGVGAPGVAQMSHYDGNCVVLPGRVAEVQLTWKSPFIAAEWDTVRFSLEDWVSVPGHPKCRVVELKFDQHGLMFVKPFAKGDVWKITLTERGELVDLQPAEQYDKFAVPKELSK